jgi:dTDP-4-dehydrorhamnose reductase
MDKFLILGSSSRLAQHFISIFPHISIPVTRSECDITDKSTLLAVFNKYDFKYILNCAALTDIEYCENNPEDTFKINYEAPRNIKLLATSLGKKAIFISSNYAVKPINVYGKSKKKLEELTDDKSLIIRTDFYDNENYIIKNLINKNPIKCYTTAFFNPVSVNRLTQEIWSNREKTGILNIFSDTCMSYLDFAKLAEDKLNIKDCKIESSELKSSLRPLNACVKSDISIKLPEDLSNYANYIKN